MVFTSFVLLSSLVHGRIQNPQDAAEAPAPETKPMYEGYKISNAMTEDYEPKFRGSYFETYSEPVSLKYAEVFYKPSNIMIPSDVVDAFKGKTMAITGWETDIVRKLEDGTEMSVPTYEIYNHHFFFVAIGDQVQMVDVPEHEREKSHPFTHIHRKPVYGTKLDAEVPESGTATLDVGGGDEHRLSFGGFPKGFAIPISSPQFFYSQIMFINTGMQHLGGGRCKADEGYFAGNNGDCPLPKGSHAPPGAKYSGLLECPCTDRIERSVQYYKQVNEGRCEVNVHDAEDCYAAAYDRGYFNASNRTVAESTLPYGCTITQSPDGKSTATYNMFKSNLNCGQGGDSGNSATGEASAQEGKIMVSLDGDSEMATISISGPDGKWFGYGFGAQVMADRPWTIIVDGSGHITEMQLENHAPGAVLPPICDVKANSVEKGVRTVICERPMKYDSPVGGEYQDPYFDFSLLDSEIDFIMAVGYSGDFSYHRAKSAGTIQMVSQGVPSCLCRTEGPNIPGTIDHGKFDYNCEPVKNGNGVVEQQNPSCNVTTYKGGLQCCKDGTILLDKDQVQPDHVDTVYVKLRVYYEDYSTQRQLHRMLKVTEANHFEYDVPKAPAGVPPSMRVHTMSVQYTPREAIDFKNDFKGHTIEDIEERGLWLMYASAHYHSPQSRYMELIHAETGQLLCKSEGIYGTSDKPQDEEEYVVGIPPCIWGFEDGLAEPIYLTLDTPLIQNIHADNTNYHTGNMAYWIMRVAIADKTPQQ